jgi:hypothetical protein
MKVMPLLVAGLPFLQVLFPLSDWSVSSSQHWEPARFAESRLLAASMRMIRLLATGFVTMRNPRGALLTSQTHPCCHPGDLLG